MKQYTELEVIKIYAKVKTLFTIFIVFIFLLVLLISGCLVTNPVLFVDKVENNLNLDTARLYRHVEKLTEIKPYRNSTNIQSLDSAAKYIYNEFKKLKCNVNYHDFKADNETYRNVVAVFNEHETQTIVIGAHYDVCGNQQGADDNASGAAGLLEIARLLDSLKPIINYRVEFVAFTTEEPPYFGTNEMGSYVYAKKCFDEKKDIKLMICLEMIGYYCENKGCQDFPIGAMKWIYPETGDFILIVNKLGHNTDLRKIKRSMKKVSQTGVYSLNAPASLTRIDLSDHRNFWEFGYNAVMITNTAFYRNKNYHEYTDQIHTLNFKKMAEVVAGVYFALCEY